MHFLFFFFSSTISVTKSQPFTIISKYLVNSTPLWIYIVSIVIGILSLICISYALYRVSLDMRQFNTQVFAYFDLNAFHFQFGFFKRGTRDNLVELKRQNELQSYWIVPGDGGDYEEGESTPLRNLQNRN